MTELVMRRSTPDVLLSHVALYGLGAILEDQGLPGVRLGWTSGENPRPIVTTSVHDETELGAAVREHARTAATADSWMQRDVLLSGHARGLMSPRLTPFGAIDTWHMVQAARHEVLDALTAGGRWLDLRFLAALGEPCYWSRNRQDVVMQDDGASRLEMQPRNQGSEFVGSRLRKLGTLLAERQPARILAGLSGESVRDEAGGDRLDSRTATGFARPGPTDNAIAWCALWGIAVLPLAMRVSRGGSRSNTPAISSGHLGRSRREWFYAPIWSDGWRPARLRTVLASRATRTVAAAGLNLRSGRVTDAEIAASRAWLEARGIEGLMRFPIERFGSDSAPERRAMRGEAVIPGSKS